MCRICDNGTELLPNSSATGGSTTSELACAAVRLACLQLVDKLKVRECVLRGVGGACVLGACSWWTSCMDVTMGAWANSKAAGPRVCPGGAAAIMHPYTRLSTPSASLLLHLSSRVSPFTMRPCHCHVLHRGLPSPVNPQAFAATMGFADRDDWTWQQLLRATKGIFGSNVSSTMSLAIVL